MVALDPLARVPRAVRISTRSSSMPQIIVEFASVHLARRERKYTSAVRHAPPNLAQVGVAVHLREAAHAFRLVLDEGPLVRVSI